MKGELIVELHARRVIIRLAILASISRLDRLANWLAQYCFRVSEVA